ncbi:MAG TPA: Ig-like domain repeat protein, partial [Symbiobacteriaceae bacterium]|nr:Ig-like domain repeat protein [Symbiobacteriaceae bacterium]
GVATVTYTIAKPVGAYQIEAAFAGDADISAASDTSTLTVTPATGSMLTADVPGVYMSTVTLSATLSPALAGKTVTFEVNGVAAGSGVTDATGLATANYLVVDSVGDHTITASFAGDGDISAASDTSTLTVTQAMGSLTAASPSAPVGQSVTLSATLTPGVAGKTVTFTVNGAGAGSGITDAAGVATATYVPLLAVGPYPIVATFAGDADISAATGNGTLTVTQGTGAITVADQTGAYLSTITLSATLSPALAGKTVTFTVNGAAAGTGTTDAAGVATASYLITNSVGTYDIVATFAGDADLTAASGTGTLTVSAATGSVTTADRTGPLGTTVTLSATLTPADAGKTITFTVNGVAAGSGITDGSGTATANYFITNPTGTYNILANWAGDANTTAASGTGTLTVTQGAGAMLTADQTGTYLSTTTLSATLTPALAGKTVTFIVNGSAAGSGTTDASGLATASYLITNSAGIYTIVASFAGDADISAASDDAILTVTQATGLITAADRTGAVGETITLTATLAPGVPGKIVSFTVDGANAGSGTTNAGGVATVSYTIAKPTGTYTISASFAGDADISAASDTSTLTVTPAAGSMLAADVPAVYMSTVTLSATLSPALAGKTVTFEVNGIAAGSGTTDATGLATTSYLVTNSVGIHTITASFAGDADISTASDTGTLTVTQATGSLTATSPSGAVGTSVTLSATLTPNVAGKTVTFTVNGVAAGSGVTDGSGVATANYLITDPTGTYNIVANFAGDADISAATGNGTLTVTQGTGVMTVPNRSVDYRSTVTLRATLTPALAGKTVTFTVNGAAAGTGTTDATGLATASYYAAISPGSYTITATFAGDADLTAATGNGTLSVSAATGTVTVADRSGAVGTTVTLQATLSPNVSGRTITFSVGGTAIGSSVTDGSGVATLDYTISRPVGTYTIDADFAGDGTITADSGSGTLTVTQGTGSMLAADQTGAYRSTTTLSATLTPALAGKTVTFTVNGVAAGSGITDATGLATVSYTITDGVGSYPIVASFAGDADLTAASDNATLTVTQATGLVSVADNTGAVGATVTLSATLSPAAAGKTVTFTVSGTAAGSGTTDAAGVATVTYTIAKSVGTHTIVASFAGDADISAATGNGTLTVTPAPGTMTVADQTGPYLSAVTLQATLAPALAGKTVNFAVNGVAAGSGTTDAAGVATAPYSINLPVGSYTIGAGFAGDGDIGPASSTGTLTVTQATGTISVADRMGALGTPVTLQATLGPAVAGKTITFTVGGTAAGSGITDASGVATVNYTISKPVGTHTIVASFAGDANISAASASGTLTVTQGTGSIVTADRTGNYLGSVTLQATLSPALAGKTVSFIVNGAAAGSGTTDASGVATSPYTINLTPGSYTITASFAGDADITAASGNGTLTVNKAASNLTVADRTTTVGGTVTLEATLSPAAPGKTINFSVGGVAVGSGTTNASGVATLIYVASRSAGSYAIDAGFAGDADFTSATGSGTLTVTQAAGSMVAADVSGQYRSVVTLTAALTPALAGKTVTFTVAGSPAGSGVTDAAGIATTNYTISNSVGSHTIVASWVGDGDITAASDTATLTVTQATGIVLAVDVTGTYGTTVTLSATLTPNEAGRQIDFFVNGVAAGTGTTNAGGVATVNFTITQAAGTHTILASHPGSTDITAASDTADLTVNRAPRTLTLAASLTTLQYSDVTVLTATVAPAVTGATITFRRDGLVVGTATTNGAGVATLNWAVDQPQPGPYAMTAEIAQDAFYLADTSNTVNVNVTRESATLYYTGDLENPNPGYMLMAKVIPQADGTTGDLTRAGTVRFRVVSSSWPNPGQTFDAAVDANGDAAVAIPNPPWENLTITATLLVNNYYEVPGPVSATVTASGDGIGLWGEYFDDPSDPNNPDGDPGAANRKYFDSYVFGRLDPQVSFDWAGTTPDPSLYGSDQLWSIRWTGFVQVPVTASNWQFCVAHDDDGARLWINGVQVVNRWSDTNSRRTDCSANLSLTAGVKVPITLEFYNATGSSADVALQWRGPVAQTVVPAANLYPPVPLPLTQGEGLVGQYYDNMNFTNLRGTRVDERINFEWQQDPPGAGITNGETFSVRWTGQYTPSVNHSHLWAWSDDGVRIFINGALVVNDYTDHSSRWSSGTIAGGFQAGVTYDIQIDYYENGTHANMELHRGNAAAAQALVSRTELSHSPGIPTPAGLTATAQAGPSRIVLNWTANAGVATIMARSYNIYRSTNPGFTAGSTTLVASVLGRTSTSWTDSAVVPGVTYYYKITAIDTAANESAPSAEASATAQ